MSKRLYPFLFMVIWGMTLFAQMPPNLPPRTVQVVEPTLPLRFGSFTAPSGSTGSVTVTTTGSITPSGSVFLMGGTVQQGMFEFRLMPGRTIIVRYPLSATINGIGGGFLTLNNLTFTVEGGTILQSGSGYFQFKSNSGSNYLHRIYMGGTLQVGDIMSNPSGDYNETIQLTIESY